MPILIIDAPKTDLPARVTGPPLAPRVSRPGELQEQKSRPRAALLHWIPRKSSLGVLLAPPRFVQADLLSLDLARVAGDQSGLAQKRLERRIELYERARQAVAHGARLPEFPPA